MDKKRKTIEIVVDSYDKVDSILEKYELSNYDKINISIFNKEESNTLAPNIYSYNIWEEASDILSNIDSSLLMSKSKKSNTEIMN